MPQARPATADSEDQMRDCPECATNGAVPSADGTGMVTCPTCGGFGRVNRRQYTRWIARQHISGGTGGASVLPPPPDEE